MNDETNPQSEPMKENDACEIKPRAAQSSAANGANPAAAGSDENDSALTDLKQELETAQNKLTEMTTITQHALADLQNIRRRSEEEKSAYVMYANADLMTQLLPVLESMNKALAHEPKDAEWIKGAEATMKQFQSTLEKRGLTPIEALNKPFDPKIHEALMAGPGEKDKVLEEYEKGYMLGDKVLKHARVRVGNGEQNA